jgi:HAAS
MTKGALHPLAEDYLQRLRRAGRHLPPDRLRDLLSEIESYLSEAIPLGASDDDVWAVLDRLGPPGDVVEAEQPAGQVPADRRGQREWAAVILLPLGGFAFGVGWLVGLILLWSSRLWTIRDKLIGTFIVPGGLATTLFFAMFAVGSTGTGGSCSGLAPEINPSTGATIRRGTIHCTTTTGGSSIATTVLHIALAVVLVLGPIVSAVYLARRARNSSPSGATPLP